MPPSDSHGNHPLISNGNSNIEIKAKGTTLEKGSSGDQQMQLQHNSNPLLK